VAMTQLRKAGGRTVAPLPTGTVSTRVGPSPRDERASRLRRASPRTGRLAGDQPSRLGTIGWATRPLGLTIS
jgi:hypothetical protein